MLKGLGIFFALINIFCGTSVFAQLKNAKQNFSHLPYDAISIINAEKNEGFLVPESVVRKAEIIIEAINDATVLPTYYSIQQAQAVCDTIYNLLSNKFKFKYRITCLLSEGLKDTVLDCNYFSVLYYTALAKRRNLPVSLVLTPGHMFIKWTINDSLKFNYETTAGRIVSDSEYYEMFNFTQLSVKRKIYFSPLTDMQAWATSYVEMASELDTTAYKKAVRLNLKAIAIDSNCLFAYINLANMMHSMKEKKAFYYFKKAIAVDSLNEYIYINMGQCYSKDNNSEKALESFSQAIRCNPNNPETYISRAREFLKNNNVDNAMQDFESATATLNRYSLFRFMNGYYSLSQLEQEIMEAYVKLHDKN